MHPTMRGCHHSHSRRISCLQPQAANQLSIPITGISLTRQPTPPDMSNLRLARYHEVCRLAPRDAMCISCSFLDQSFVLRAHEVVTGKKSSHPSPFLCLSVIPNESWPFIIIRSCLADEEMTGSNLDCHHFGPREFGLPAAQWTQSVHYRRMHLNFGRVKPR